MRKAIAIDAIQGHCADGCAWEEAAWERLAAYEDTGLEPEEVVQTKLALIGKALAEIKEIEGITTNRMIELAQAEKDGRLVALPPNDPLTLEELREMDGQPVWVVGVSKVNNFKGHWDICEWDGDEGVIFPYCGETPDTDLLGTSWFAYRHRLEEGSDK